MDELPNYKILRYLGRGSFGEVYHCIHRQKKKEYCIKKIKLRAPLILSSASSSISSSSDIIISQTTLDKNFHLQVILREIYLLMNLFHPRIIKYENFSFNERFFYIVMEYAPNGTLAQLIVTQKKQHLLFSLKDIICYFCDILMALEYLHLRKVVHRDLKPENILIAIDGRLKIGDFGTSKIQCTKTKQIGTDNDCTALYMAPESLSSQIYNFATDIWALGCILYELFTLKHPFGKARSRADILYLAMQADSLHINHTNKDLEKSINSLVRSILQPKPQNRATLSRIIHHRFILKQYHGSHFDY